MLYVTKQLGRSTNNECLPNGTIATQQIRTKTHHSVRNVPLPQFVIDELILSRARYEKKRNENPYFIDSGYITCHESGLPFNRSYATKPLKALLNECGIPLFHWHDIRHIYATILKDNEISLKAISMALGHGSEKLTDKVYIEKKKKYWTAVVI